MMRLPLPSSMRHGSWSARLVAGSATLCSMVVGAEGSVAVAGAVAVSQHNELGLWDTGEAETAAPDVPCSWAISWAQGRVVGSCFE